MKMTRPGRVRTERLQELQRLVNLTELSDDPKAVLTAKDIILEGYRQGIGIDERFTQHEVIGEVFLQWLICSTQQDISLLPGNKNQRREKLHLFRGLCLPCKPGHTADSTTIPVAASTTPAAATICTHAAASAAKPTPAQASCFAQGRAGAAQTTKFEI